MADEGSPRDAAPGNAGAGAGRPRRRKGRVARIRASIRRRVRGAPEPVVVQPPPIRPPSTGFGIEQLHRATFVPSDDPAYRLNLVVPTLDAARVFGGIRTAMDVFEEVASAAPERRIIAGGAAPKPKPEPEGATAGGPQQPGTLDAAGTVHRDKTPPGGSTAEPRAPDDGVAGQAVAGDAGDRSEAEAASGDVVVLGDPSATLTVRRNDVFIATFWTTAELVHRIRRWQALTYGQAPRAFGYIVQDYEPSFYPSSVASELARATYDDPAATVAVFNTSVLRDWFHGLGIEFGSEHVFEPRILPQLLAAIDAPANPRSRTILVYGRPKTPRNAFPAIVDGLRAWRAANPERAQTWTVVSIGQEHPDIDLGEGMVLHSIGKLSLEDYALRLREAAVGISLMVSPHPSYPPLEMAHLGMLVVTNRFGPKDLAAWHPNISNTDDLTPDGMARAIDRACRTFEQDAAAGDRHTPRTTSFAAEAPQFPFAAHLAAELEAAASPEPSAGADIGAPPETDPATDGPARPETAHR